MADRVGQRLGNYHLQRLLGKGGFAEVYLGQHLRLNTQAAIKVLHTRLASEEEVEGFQKEAQTIARLVNPHIVRVLDFDVEEDTPFLVMDYAPGGTLRQRHRKGTRLDPETIVPYVKQVAEALHFAHEQQLVHRDVKPENMLIGERHQVLLSDFGIATVAQSSRYQGTQEVAGTVAYMAPEQVQGKPRPASDQYALGVVIYEWMTGERPFHGSFTEIATQHVLTPPPPLREKLPEIAPALDEVVLTALAKDPKARFASVNAFVTAFEHACQNAALHFAPTHVITPVSPAARPTAIIPPVSENTPSPRLPLPIVVPPAHAPAEQNAAFTATTPVWRDIPRTAPSVPATWTSVPPSSSPHSPAGISTASGKVTARPKRHGAKRATLAGCLTLVVLLAVAAGIFWQVTRFHQEVTTGPLITRIQVGTGYSAPSSAVQGETDTFHIGNTVYVVMSVSRMSEGSSFDVTLFLENNSVYSDYIFVGLRSPGTFEAHLPVTSPGIYTWKLDYNGTPEASITFQVVS